MSGPFVNTLVVCSGTGLLASLLGLTLALLTTCLRVPLHRWMSSIVLSLVFVPIYVQATAWSAGFGVTGWFRLSQVAAAMSPTTALASVVWIQSMAMVPVCFLLCQLGIRRSFDANIRQALLDFGPGWTIIHVLLPKLWPWIAAGALWSVAMTGNDMVVTNLFQVPTITETVYQQVQFNELDPASIAWACSFALLIGLLLWSLICLLQSRLGHESSSETSSAVSMDAFELKGMARVVSAAIGWIVVSMVAFVPLANLIVKAGWVASMDEGQLRRSWSPLVLVHSISQARTFSGEIGWSLEISLLSTGLALALGSGLLCCARAKWSAWLATGMMVCLLAIPGPIVNLFVIWLFDRREPQWIGFLADRTLCGPVLALQSRCLPIVFGILWLAMQRFEKQNEALLLLDRSLPLASRVWIRLTALRSPIFIAAVVSFFIAFADLSSYLLVQPPQVTTVAMRMFDLLHYGIKNRESGLALALVLAGVLPTLLWMRRSPPE